MQNLVLISLFGMAGVLTRYGIDQFFGTLNEQFPFSTLIINICGSFLAGVIYVAGENTFPSQSIQLVLLVGFCGGFTTFSAYTLQVVTMIDRGRLLPGLSYLFLSPLLGTLAALFAILLFRKMLG